MAKFIKDDYSSEWWKWQKGDKFVVDNTRSDSYTSFAHGITVRLHVNDSTDCFQYSTPFTPLLTYEYNEVMIPKEDWDKEQEYLKQLEEGHVNMTPCEKLGYKVGDKFWVREHPGSSAFTKNSVISLFDDDGSKSPLFKLVEGDCNHSHAEGKPGAYISLEYISRLEPSVKREETPTHNIEAGDWTCHQGDEELFEKLKQACVNAGIAQEGCRKQISDPLLVVYRDSCSGKVVWELDSTLDEDFVNYRTPEYFLTAANAQPPEQTERDKEISAITEWIEKISVRDFTDTSSFAECMYENGFKMSCLESE